MKNLKILLSAFVMLAIVGGALAFKTKTNVPGNIYCSSTAPNPFVLCSAQFSSSQLIDFQINFPGSTGNSCTGIGVFTYVNFGTCCCTSLGSIPWVATHEH